jgi:hypothetical protein
MSPKQRRTVDTSTIDGRLAVEFLLPLLLILAGLAALGWRFLFLPPDEFWSFLTVRNLPYVCYASSAYLFLLWFLRRRR